ncbi:hypothetical protein D9756_003481 [Leucocoprinus leucothites]|uniref:F-box domain-containing protein n=1 Tax=Leucocoprinus leucothites TaxID=201217 RepID=A0A8H5LIU6_9AGAR|nr:hypothetical protein D9756_003481 [Leucoagaricus leucothites]
MTELSPSGSFDCAPELGIWGIHPILPNRAASKYVKEQRSRQRRIRASYWEYLPLEIWAEIFIKCLPLRRDRRPVRKSPPFLLTQICRAWYRIVVELPQMWSTIVLTTYTSISSISDSALHSGARFLEMSIARTKGAPVELYLRAEFLSRTASFDQIQRISTRISHLTIIFPLTPSVYNEDVRPTYFPRGGCLSMPNLRGIEVYNQEKHKAIASQDTSQLEHIIKSSYSLGCGIFCNRVPGINGPLILQNTSNIEILSIEEPIPLSVCFFLLQNIPTLQELSLLKIVMHPEHAPVYEDQLLKSVLSALGIYQPFVHSRLQCLALAYCEGNPSSFFKLVTLPQLHYIVIDLRADEKISWPQSDFMAFLQRSDCKLHSLTLIDQPISSFQLLEILRFPNVGDTIDSLSIQNYRDVECIFDESILEQLTVEAGSGHERSQVCKDGGTPPPILCPSLEDVALFVPLENAVICKLVNMLKSRSLAQMGGVSRTHPRKALRRIQMDFNPDLKPYLGDLRRAGLILRLYEQNQYDPSPIGMRQLAMLRKYLSGRGKCIVFEHVTGKWDGLLLDE